MKRKSNDRSTCRVCGIELTPDNAYCRRDTLNGLHAYCKKHFLEIQKERALRVKTAPYTYLVKRGNHRPFRLYFMTLEEKQEYIRGRYNQIVCGHTTVNVSDSELRSDGCAAMFGDPEFCDDVKPDGTVCGGRLRYDSSSELVCELCGVIADVIPFYRETPYPLMKGRHAWTGDSADSQIVDSFYNKAYGNK
jgi:hypothetical protein